MGVPRPFIQESPSALTVREGGGCLSVFGLPFLMAGLWVAGLGFGIVHMNDGQSMPNAARIVMVVFGLVFSAVGGALVLGRRWLSIDTFKRQITDQYGLLVPMKTKVESLGNYCSVSLGFKEGDSDSSESYPINLVRNDKGSVYHIMSPLHYKEAREQASFLATFTHLPLEDKTTEKVTLSKPWETKSSRRPTDVEVDEGGASLRCQPATLVSDVEESVDQLTLSAPVPRLPFGTIVLALIPTVLLVAFAFSSGVRFDRFVLTREMFDFYNVENVFVLFFYFFFLFVVWNMTVRPLTTFFRSYRRSQNGKWIATLSRTGLTINDQGSKTHQIPIGDILSIEASIAILPEERLRSVKNLHMRGMLTYLAQKKNLLVVKTKAEILSFPLGIPPNETDYLAEIMVRKLMAFR